LKIYVNKPAIDRKKRETARRTPKDFQVGKRILISINVLLNRSKSIEKRVIMFYVENKF
jgi:hypothetical protein